MFDQQTRRLNNETLNQMATYQLGQRRAWQDTTTDAAVTSAQDDAIGYWDNPQKFQASVSQSDSAIADAGTRNVWAPEFTQMTEPAYSTDHAHPQKK